ncbi:MAG: hypothetical protein IKP20_05150 [Candidatus Methanomethylophilaceae archaeon]|nr:hypothetical protein [Candidatus Methanomethylophilaceae archaeon]
MRILRPDKTDLEVLLGDPRKAIDSMVIPLLVAMAVVEINQFVDTFWVAGLGNVSAEAVATVTPIYGLMMCAGLGIGVGATTTIAFQLGNGNRERANGLALNSLILGAIFAVASSIAVALLFDPALEFMGAADVRSESWGYMLPLAILSPALLINSIMGGMLRGEGAAKKSTVMQMSAAIMNMAIDPILIYGLGLGVMGAGLSTAISALLSLAIGLRWYAKGKTAVSLGNGSFRADASMMKEILGVGGPKTVQSMISNLTDFVHRIFLIVAGGTTAVMLYNYPWRYIGLVNLPGRAFENAMVPVCSAAYGKSDLEKMKAGYMYTFKIAFIVAIIAAAMLFIFAEPLMSLLTYEESMHQLLPKFVWTLRVAVFLIPFSALMGIGSSMLQSMKKAKIPMYFYMLWGFLKLGTYAVAAYGYLGMDPFEGIIYCMVGVHVFGGACLMLMTWHEFNKIRAAIEG